MPIRSRPALFLDLDGTLVDSAPGILASIRGAVAQLADPIPDATDLTWVIGPPIRDVLRQFLGDRAHPEEGLRLYRQRYSERGLYEALVYPGVLEALAHHQARGARLFICTSKARVFAERVADHFGLSPFLSGVYGSELDGRREDKAELIGHILETEGLEAADVCMVGDRLHDVHGAARHGVPTIGVCWGFGGRAELEAAGAALVIDQADELHAR